MSHEYTHSTPADFGGAMVGLCLTLGGLCAEILAFNVQSITAVCALVGCFVTLFCSIPKLVDVYWYIALGRWRKPPKP